jgi:alkanesulfonate monooxygenase SsuD/methylene tetrahydromethanopterin reductase-like flavin-dependent oxidoreductase (luciferase family)
VAGAAACVTISVTLPQFVEDASVLTTGARRAESLGFDGVFVFDHLFPLDGKHRPIFESTVALGAVIASTTRVTVGSLVLRAPMRQPERTARAVVTASRLSGGRLVCGLGVGDSLSRPEFEAYGLEFPDIDRRIASLRETVRLVRQRSQTPVWIGGTSRRIQQVAAETADGWNVWNVSAEWLRARRAYPTAPTVSWGGQVLLARDEPSLAEALQRRRGNVLAATVDTLPGKLAELQQAGVSDFVLSLLGDTWQLFAEAVMPSLHRTTGDG